MMETKSIEIREVRTETHFFAGKPRKNLMFEAKIGEEVWEFDLRLGEGEMHVDSIHRTYPWLACYVTRGDDTIRAGEIPFDEEIAERFEWEPEWDALEFLRIFLEKRKEYRKNSGYEEDFVIQIAAEDAILHWGARVAKSLES